jgi:hypothetical protein
MSNVIQFDGGPEKPVDRSSDPFCIVSDMGDDLHAIRELTSAISLVLEAESVEIEDGPRRTLGRLAKEIIRHAESLEAARGDAWHLLLPQPVA